MTNLANQIEQGLDTMYKLEKCYTYRVCNFCGESIHKGKLASHIRSKHKAVANKLGFSTFRGERQ